MKKINVRLLLPSDLPAIQKVALETWSDTYGSFIPEEDILEDHNKHCNIEALGKLYKKRDGMVGEVDNEVVAYSTCGLNEEMNRYHIYSLYILPDYQGHGLGKKLLGLAYEKAKELGFDRVWLGVMEKNTKTLEWYRSQGFQFVEEEPFTMGKTIVNCLNGYKLIS
ncbi:GNAT family N-acetyltransferase [candidate division KSB1 bacterium]|nr:GNAT family N-acetyltransferase [candidate division KSB1 bacterium]